MAHAHAIWLSHGYMSNSSLMSKTTAPMTTTLAASLVLQEEHQLYSLATPETQRKTLICSRNFSVREKEIWLKVPATSTIMCLQRVLTVGLLYLQALLDTADDLLVVHVARQIAYWTLGAFIIQRVTTEPRLDQKAEVESAAQPSVTSGIRIVTLIEWHVVRAGVASVFIMLPVIQGNFLC